MLTPVTTLLYQSNHCSKHLKEYKHSNHLEGMVHQRMFQHQVKAKMHKAKAWNCDSFAPQRDASITLAGACLPMFSAPGNREAAFSPAFRSTEADIGLARPDRSGSWPGENMSHQHHILHEQQRHQAFPT